MDVVKIVLFLIPAACGVYCVSKAGEAANQNKAGSVVFWCFFTGINLISVYNILNI
jgi:hypothetical protein